MYIINVYFQRVVMNVFMSPSVGNVILAIPMWLHGFPSADAWNVFE